MSEENDLWVATKRGILEARKLAVKTDEKDPWADALRVLVDEVNAEWRNNGVEALIALDSNSYSSHDGYFYIILVDLRDGSRSRSGTHPGTSIGAVCWDFKPQATGYFSPRQAPMLYRFCSPDEIRKALLFFLADPMTGTVLGKIIDL